MASSSIISWKKDGGKVDTVKDFIFLGSKTTVGGDCNYEIKRCLLLGRIAMKNLDSVLKSRDITLPTKICIVKAMVLPVVMYRCESWTIKKAEGQRINAFKLWCWRRLLRVTWIARRPNLSILREINSEYSLEVLALKLKLKIFWPPVAKSQLIGKDPDAGKDWRQEEKRGDRGWDDWMASPTQWTWVWAKSRSQWRMRNPGMLFMALQRVRPDLATRQQQKLWKIVGEASKKKSLKHLKNERYSKPFSRKSYRMYTPAEYKPKKKKSENMVSSMQNI